MKQEKWKRKERTRDGVFVFNIRAAIYSDLGVFVIIYLFAEIEAVSLVIEDKGKNYVFCK